VAYDSQGDVKEHSLEFLSVRHAEEELNSGLC
jgi:hypothetical protein